MTDELAKDLEDNWHDLQACSIPSMSREDLSKFVMDLVDGKLFTLHHIPEDQRDMAHMVFVPVALGALAGVRMEDFGTAWEYIDKAGPRAVNGYPMFMSLHLMNFEDWELAHKAYAREMAKRSEDMKGVLEGL